MRQAIPGIERRLHAITALAQAQKSTLILTLMPSDWPSLAGYRVYADELTSVAAQLNVPIVRFDSILGSPVDRDVFLPVDLAHPNQVGHPLMAEHARKKAESDGDISRPLSIPWLGKSTEKSDQSIQAKQV